MKPNIGPLDKAARIFVALVIAGLYLTQEISGTFAVILLVLAAVFIITSFIGICPLYAPFGISTRKKKTSVSPSVDPNLEMKVWSR